MEKESTDPIDAHLSPRMAGTIPAPWLHDCSPRGAYPLLPLLWFSSFGAHSALALSLLAKVQKEIQPM